MLGLRSIPTRESASPPTRWSAQTLLVHDLHPVPLEERVAAALEQRAAVPRLARGRRGAARARGRRRDICFSRAAATAAPRRRDARARDRAGARGGRAGPARGRGRGRGRQDPLRRRRCCPSCRGTSSSRPPSRACSRRRRAGSLVANVAGTLLAYRDRCAGCGASLASGSLEDGTLECPSCRRQYSLPLAGRVIGQEDLQLEPVPLLLRGRPRPGRRMTSRPASFGGRTAARPAPRGRALRPVRLDGRAGSPAPPAPRGAPDPVRLRELLRSALGRSRAATDRDTAPSGSTDFSLPEEVWAGFRIPIGLAFLFRSSVTGGMVAFYPSPRVPRRASSTLDAWDELVAANPVLETLEPDVEALIVNRLADPPQGAIAPIDRCYALVGLVKLRWEGINGGTRLKDAIAGFFEELREVSVAVERSGARARGDERWRRPRTRRRRRLRFTVGVSDDERAGGLHDRAHRAGPDRRRPPRVRPRDTGAAARPVRRARADPGDGGHRADRRASRRSCRASAASGTFELLVAGERRPRARREPVSRLALRRRRCRSPSSSTARSSTAASTTGCR